MVTVNLTNPTPKLNSLLDPAPFLIAARTGASSVAWPSVMTNTFLGGSVKESLDGPPLSEACVGERRFRECKGRQRSVEPREATVPCTRQ